MRKSHPDAKYIAVILQYVKKFAVTFNHLTRILSVDDKAIIPVGEPDNPISTGVRGHHRSLAVAGSGPTLAALDHDFHVFGVVPSVALAIEIPDSANDSFFSGHPYVTSKDKITQPSSPYRHSVELVHLIKSTPLDDPKPVLVILSDGGPDHRLCYGSVQISMIALFSKLNLDMLVCMQMCPYQSWTNPAERVMSTLNLALQNVSLMRARMDDEMENAIKYKNNLAAIRSEIEEKPGLKTAVQGSVSPVIDLLNKRFSRMKLKGNQIQICPAATEEDILDNFECVHFIDPNLKMGDLNQDTLKDAKDLQEFMKTHCNSARYLFQIKKCGKDTCSYCTTHPVQLHQSEFDKLKFIPLPLINATKDHYKKFDELYGQPPSEVDRPSLSSGSVPSEAKAVDRENKKLLVAAKVRSTIICLECNKPRCIYSAGTLTIEEKVVLRQVIESRAYSCGCQLFPQGSPFHDTIICRYALTLWKHSIIAVPVSHALPRP